MLVKCFAIRCYVEYSTGFGSLLISPPYLLQQARYISPLPTVCQIRFIDFRTIAKWTVQIGPKTKHLNWKGPIEIVFIVALK